MTGHFNYLGASTFVCVDFNAEVVPGEAANDDGALLYHVQVSCSYMECSVHHTITKGKCPALCAPSRAAVGTGAPVLK